VVGLSTLPPACAQCLEILEASTPFSPPVQACNVIACFISTTKIKHFGFHHIHIVICIRTLCSLLGEYKLSEQIIAYSLQGKYVGALGYTNTLHVAINWQIR